MVVRDKTAKRGGSQRQGQNPLSWSQRVLLIILVPTERQGGKSISREQNVSQVVLMLQEESCLFVQKADE